MDSYSFEILEREEDWRRRGVSPGGNLGQTAETQAEQEWWTEASVVPNVGQTPRGQWTITDLMMTFNIYIHV